MHLGLARATGIGSAIGAAAGIGVLAGWSGLGGLYAITALRGRVVLRRRSRDSARHRGRPRAVPGARRQRRGLLGFIQMMTGLVVNGLSSLWYDGTPRAMATLNGLCAMAALAAYPTLLRARR